MAATFGNSEKVEEEPVFLRLRSAASDNTNECQLEGPTELPIFIKVMPFNTWQVVKRRLKERFPCLKAIPDQNIRLLHKSIELRSNNMIDDYNLEGGTSQDPAELRYLVIDHCAADTKGKSAAPREDIGMYVDTQVPCTQGLRTLVTACFEHMRAGTLPRLTDEGTGATYILRDTDHRNLAVFKPKDEEAFAPQNPRGYLGPENTPGLRQGVLSTQQAAREVAAFLLDHGEFARVPETALVHAKHPKFSKVKTKSGDKVVWKIGAFQRFVETKDTAGNFAAQVFSATDVHKIGILDIRIANLDRNDGNMLIRVGKSQTGSVRYELVPIDHGLSLPDCLEVYTDDIAWMEWPQAKKPFAQKELDYIQKLSGSKDARLLAKCLGVRRECLRLMEVTTKLLQLGADHGLTLYEIGTIMYRIDRGTDAPVQRSKLEHLIEHSLDMALTVAGDGPAANAVSSTLAGLDLNTSRQISGAKFSRQYSGCGTNIMLTPMLGPSSPISSPLCTSPMLDDPPPYSLDGGFGTSDSEYGGNMDFSLVEKRESAPALSSRSTAGKVDEPAGEGRAPRQTPRTSTQRTSLRTGSSYRIGGGTKLRHRTSAALVAMHREGEGGRETPSIFSRPGLRGSDWSPELEKMFKTYVTNEIAGYIKKNFRKPISRQTSGTFTEDSQKKEKKEADDVPEENDTSLASAFGRMPSSLEDTDETPSSTRSAAPEPAPEGEAPKGEAPAKKAYVPPHLRRLASGAGAGEPSAVLPPEGDEEPAPVFAPPARPPPVKYVPPQQRRADEEAVALAPVEESPEEGKVEEPTLAPRAKYVPPFMRKAMATEAAAAPPQETPTPSASSTAPVAIVPPSLDLPTELAGGNGRVGFCVHQGPRANMEDAVDAIHNFAREKNLEFYAVYDGHSGPQAVEFVKKRLPSILLSQKPDFGDRASLEKAFSDAFTICDDECMEHLQDSKPDLPNNESALYVLSSGCVGCVAIVRNSVVHVANLGDCRAVLCNGGEMEQLTVDHGPSVNEAERVRLVAMGVDVSSDGYLHGRIGVSRAFGDWAWHQEEKCKGLICDPDIFLAEVKEDTEFLLLACDGVFEKLSTKEAGLIVRRKLRATGDAKAAAEALVEMALKSNGSDNLSAIVVLFKRPEAPGGGEQRAAPKLFGRRFVLTEPPAEEGAAAAPAGEAPALAPAVS